MTKEEFFRKINNPLDDNKVLKLILESFSNDNDLYYDLIKENAKKEDKITGKYNKEDNKEYNCYIFNIWKNYIIKRNIEKIKPEYRNILIELKEKLKDINPKTTNEIIEIFNNKNNIFSKEAIEFLDKYSYKAQGKYSGWTHISDEYISLFKRKRPIIKHRLYLNINSTYLDKFLKLFTEKCIEKKLPYYYKYFDIANRADTLVIYSDTKNLFKYINILEEIKRENKEKIEENIKKPPILSANIDNWIGYGSESQLKLKSNKSYNSLRERVIKNVLINFNKSWTRQHINKKVIINNKEIPYKDFLSDLIYQSYIEELDKKYDFYKNNENNLFESIHGYSIEITKTDKFRKYLKIIIDKNMDIIINNIEKLDEIKPEQLYKLQINKGKLNLDKSIIYKALKKQPLILSKQNNDFYNQLRNAIINEGERVNIPRENFCFDKNSLEELKQLENNNSIKMTDQEIKQTKTKSKTLRKKINENTKVNNNYIDGDLNIKLSTSQYK